MTELLLYTTAGCHLCEQAEQMLEQLQPAHDFVLHKVDIAEDSELVERYGIRIPVVRNQVIDRELGWPFQAQDLLSLF